MKTFNISWLPEVYYNGLSGASCLGLTPYNCSHSIDIQLLYGAHIWREEFFSAPRFEPAIVVPGRGGLQLTGDETSYRPPC